MKHSLNAVVCQLTGCDFIVSSRMGVEKKTWSGKSQKWYETNRKLSHILHTLKMKHSLNAVVCQLTGCDFIVSSRMGVEKKTWSGKSQKWHETNRKPSHILCTLKMKHSLNAVVCQLNGCDFIVSSRMGVEKKTWSGKSQKWHETNRKLSHILCTLRMKHNMNAVVCQLNGCDFIVSSRMGVEKKTWSGKSQKWHETNRKLSHILCTLRMKHNMNAVVCQLNGCDFNVSSRIGVEKKTWSGKSQKWYEANRKPSHILCTLRMKHSLNAVVCQLTGCDFIVSSRMGVEKKTWSGKS